MACFDGGPTIAEEARNSEREERIRRKRAEAMLCAIVLAIEKRGDLEHVLAYFDENRAGITVDQFRVWWDAHKSADAKK